VLAAAARLDRVAGSEGGGEARGGARAVRRRLGGFPGRWVCPRGRPDPAPPRLPHAPLTPLPATRPAHALYFAAYEAAKEALGGGGEGHHPFAVAAAGVFATITSDACMTPFDVVKQRLQARHACATSASSRPSRPVPRRRCRPGHRWSAAPTQACGTACRAPCARRAWARSSGRIEPRRGPAAVTGRLVGRRPWLSSAADAAQARRSS